MKLLITVAILILSFSVNADEAKDKDKGQKFETHKAKVLANIDTRISSLNTFKTCVSGATERKAVKDCRKAHRDRVKDLKGKKKGKKK